MRRETVAVLAACAMCACGGQTPPVVSQPPPPEPPEPAAVCTRREEVPAPAPRVVDGYPLPVRTYTPEELTEQVREIHARSPDWTVELDRFGYLRVAWRVPPPGAAHGSIHEAEPTEDDLERVRELVRDNPAIFGDTDAERVITPSRIGSAITVQYASTGAISIHTAGPVVDPARGRSFPTTRLTPAEAFAPWGDTELVECQLTEDTPICDPVTPSGSECDVAPPPAPPPPTVIHFADVWQRAQLQVQVAGTPPALREVYWLPLHPQGECVATACAPVPEMIDAHTGEVLQWTPAMP